MICVLVAEGFCVNCADESYRHRGEQPIRDLEGREFCDVDCLDEFHRRLEVEWVYYNVRCSGCSNHRRDRCICADICTWNVMRFLLGDGWDAP